MSAKRMTGPQRAAVEQVDGDLAISAGAGSGKTTVLAHRFAAALAPTAAAPWAPAAVDQVLTITFTKKAANEIAERVRQVVNESISRETGRRVGEAWISTFHTFCGRLVRRHLLESGVEPGFTQLDEVGAVAVAVEAFEAACSEHYEADVDVRRLVDAWGAVALRDAIKSAHQNVRAMGLDPRDAVVPSGADSLGDLLSDAVAAARDYTSELAECKQTTSVIAKTAGLRSWCDALGSCPIDDDLCARILELASGGDTARLAATDARDRYRVARNALDEATAAASDPELFRALELLMRTYSHQYALIKNKRAALDFDDLQERAVGLLTEQPEVAEQYRSRFRMLMVDEFQDTNDLQMRVLDPLRHGNLCIVGDERQSIYGFRYADVKVFERVRTQLGNTIELAQNFRSHPSIMTFVNETFSAPHLFGADFMRLGAGRQDGWKLERAADEPRVECLLVDVEGCGVDAARAAEAEEIALRIEQLLDQGMHGEDIAILLRGGRQAPVYAHALEQHGIPVLVSAGMSLYDARETGEVLALLRTIAVPGDDEALLQVLGGRFVALSDDALLAIRAATPPGQSLWAGLHEIAGRDAVESALAAADHAAAVHAHVTIELFGSAQGRFGLAEILHRACEAFDYDLMLFSQGAEGVRAWATVLKLARAADLFESSESSDLAAFVAYLHDRQDSAKDKAAAADAGEDAVRIMTIHAAKGLEFPVVFAADLAAHKSHGTDNLLVGRETIDGVDIPVLGVRPPKTAFGNMATATYQSMAPAVQGASVEEEKRCLYVAATRAEELLVLSGATEVGKPASEGRRLIDWVRESLGDPSSTGTVQLGEASALVTVIDADDMPPEPRESALSATAPAFAIPAVELRAGATPLGRPQSVSYTALHLHERCPLSYHVRYALRLGRFVNPDAQNSTGLGSAFHALMESTVPSGAPSADSYELIAKRFGLDADQRTRLTRAAETFADSETARRLNGCEVVRREEPLRVPVNNTMVVGSIDAIGWLGSSAFVVDYKTGHGPDDIDDSRRGAYELQAKTYALAAFEGGASEVEVAFCFVEHQAQTITHRFTREADCEELRDEIGRRITEIAEGGTQHLPVYDRNVCEGCAALGGLCPIDAPIRRR